MSALQAQARETMDIMPFIKSTFVLLLVIVAALLAGCGPPNVVNSLEDVEGKTIGALAGTPSFRLASEYGTARAFQTAEEMMADLRSGLLDCAIMESTTAQELVAETSGVRILFEPLAEYDLRFAVPKENQRLLKAVNSALETLGRNGTLRGLYNKYFARRSYTYVPPEIDEYQEGRLTVALPPDSPPLSFRDADGNFVGMDVEVAIALGDVLGVEIIALETDSTELVNAVWYGWADLALGWHPIEGEGVVSVSEPYAQVVQVVIVRR